MSGSDWRARLRAGLREHESGRERSTEGVPGLPEGLTFVRELGRGGMGRVVLARDEHLGREVAVKILLAGSSAGAAARDRFEREARVLASLRHRHLVQVHRLVRDGSQLSMVLEYVPGASLAELLADGPLEPLEAVRLIRQAAEGLQCAHQAGVLHRDVKPGNILLREGDAVLADFGLARPLDDHQDLTRSGQLLGTAAYLPPEQAFRSREVDPRSDVYSLGATLYHALTGQVPLPAETLAAQLDLLAQATPADPVGLRPGLDPGLARICMRCLAKDPEERYPDAGALAQALREWSERPATDLTRRRLLLSAALAAGGAAIWGSWRLAARGQRAPQPLPPTPTPSPVPRPSATSEREGQVSMELPGVRALSFLGPDRLAVLAGGEVTLWALGPTPGLTRRWPAPPRAVWLLTGSSCLLAGGAGETLWVETDQDVAHTLTLGSDAAAWSEASRLVLSAAGRGQLLQLSSWQAEPQARWRLEGVTPRCLASQGPLLAAATWDREEARLFVFEADGPPTSSWVLNARPRALAPGPTPGSWIVGLSSGLLLRLEASPGYDQRVPDAAPLLNPSRGSGGQPTSRASTSHPGPIVGLALAEEGRLLLAANASTRLLTEPQHELRAWDLEGRTLRGAPLTSPSAFVALTVSPDGSRVAWACADGRVRVQGLADLLRLLEAG